MIYILLANGFEEVEAITVIDYLRRCEQLKVITVGVDTNSPTGSHNIELKSDMLINDVELTTNIEMIVLPGGMPGTTNLDNNPKVQQLISYCIENNIYIGAICAAPSILGKKGYLNNKKATCYKGFESTLEGAEIVNSPVVHDGNIITSMGAGTSQQFAFKLIELVAGNAQSTKIMEAVLWQKVN